MSKIIRPGSPGRRQALAIGAGLAALARPARARTEPFLDRPARILVGFAAGSALDIVARAYAEQLRGVYAPQVVVEVRNGAAGRLAMEAVKTSPPDGTSLVLTPESTLIIHPHIFPRSLPYDPAQDFTPISTASSYPFIVVVAPNNPARDLAGFAAWARQQGDITYGSAGAGSSLHFLGVSMAEALGIPTIMRHVPYRDTGIMLTDLQANRLPCAMQVLGVYGEHHRAGRVRILAVSTAERVPSIADVPTFAELGYPQLTTSGWYSILGPAGMPERAVQTLNAALGAASRNDELVRILGRAEQRPLHSSPLELQERMRSGREHWGEIVRRTGFNGDA